MKKFAAVLFVILFSAAVSAQIVKTGSDNNTDIAKGEKLKLDAVYSLYGIAYGISGVQDDYVYDVAHIRLNPGLTLSAGNARGGFMFGIDQDFGRNGITASDSGADPGTDNFVVGVSRAYIEVSNMIIPGITAAAGLDQYSFPLVVDNDFALARGSYDFSMGKVMLCFIKINEYSRVEKDAANVEDHRDVDAFAADAILKFSIFSLRPGFIFIMGGEQSTLAADARIANFALNITADSGIVHFSLTGAFMKGNSGASTNISAYAFDAASEIKLSGSVRAGVFCTFGSGDDETSADDKSYFFNINNLFGTAAGKTGAPDGRLLLLENATVAGSTAEGNVYDTMDDSRGYMSAGLFCAVDFMKMKLSAQWGIASLAAADAYGNKLIGSEFDLGAAYRVAYNTELFIEAAYLLARDVVVGPVSLITPENAAQFAFGITTDL